MPPTTKKEDDRTALVGCHQGCSATVVGTVLIPVMYFVLQSIREKVKGAPKVQVAET